MLAFSPEKYLTLGRILARMNMSLTFPEGILPSKPLALVRERSMKAFFDELPLLRNECATVGLRMSVSQLDRIREDQNEPPEHLAELLRDFERRVNDELEAQAFLALEFPEQEFYEHPFRQWEAVVSRFSGVTGDVEEASKCYALERYAASIFHLMRITEAGVLELGKLLDPLDYKPQFGSVLNKIDHLLQKTKWPDWPDDAKPHKAFLSDVLPRLYAVKDSWRDKASHFDTHIVPNTASTNRERARDIYNSTLSLMSLLAERLPNVPSSGHEA